MKLMTEELTFGYTWCKIIYVGTNCVRPLNYEYYIGSISRTNTVRPYIQIKIIGANNETIKNHIYPNP